MAEFNPTALVPAQVNMGQAVSEGIKLGQQSRYANALRGFDPNDPNAMSKATDAAIQSGNIADAVNLQNAALTRYKMTQGLSALKDMQAMMGGTKPTALAGTAAAPMASAPMASAAAAPAEAAPAGITPEQGHAFHSAVVDGASSILNAGPEGSPERAQAAQGAVSAFKQKYPGMTDDMINSQLGDLSDSTLNGIIQKDSGHAETHRTAMEAAGGPAPTGEVGAAPAAPKAAGGAPEAAPEAGGAAAPAAVAERLANAPPAVAAAAQAKPPTTYQISQYASQHGVSQEQADKILSTEFQLKAAIVKDFLGMDVTPITEAAKYANEPTHQAEIKRQEYLSSPQTLTDSKTGREYSFTTGKALEDFKMANPDIVPGKLTPGEAAAQTAEGTETGMGGIKGIEVYFNGIKKTIGPDEAKILYANPKLADTIGFGVQLSPEQQAEQTARGSAQGTLGTDIISLKGPEGVDITTTKKAAIEAGGAKGGLITQTTSPIAMGSKTTETAQANELLKPRPEAITAAKTTRGITDSIIKYASEHNITPLSVVDRNYTTLLSSLGNEKAIAKAGQTATYISLINQLSSQAGKSEFGARAGMAADISLLARQIGSTSPSDSAIIYAATKQALDNYEEKVEHAKEVVGASLEGQAKNPSKVQTEIQRRLPDTLYSDPVWQKIKIHDSRGNISPVLSPVKEYYGKKYRVFLPTGKVFEVK